MLNGSLHILFLGVLEDADNMTGCFFFLYYEKLTQKKSSQIFQKCEVLSLFLPYSSNDTTAIRLGWGV